MKVAAYQAPLLPGYFWQLTVGPLSFGIMICNDSNYPELATDMVARGARAIFVPSHNGLPRKGPMWRA
jgi:predicted amidohydrolase